MTTTRFFWATSGAGPENINVNSSDTIGGHTDSSGGIVPTEFVDSADTLNIAFSYERLIDVLQNATDTIAGIAESAWVAFGVDSSDTITALTDAANYAVAISSSDLISSLSDVGQVTGYETFASDLIQSMTDNDRIILFNLTTSDTLTALSDSVYVSLSVSASDTISLALDYATFLNVGVTVGDEISLNLGETHQGTTVALLTTDNIEALGDSLNTLAVELSSNDTIVLLSEGSLLEKGFQTKVWNDQTQQWDVCVLNVIKNGAWVVPVPNIVDNGDWRNR